MDTANELGRRKVGAALGIAAFVGTIGVVMAGCSASTNPSKSAATDAATSVSAATGSATPTGSTAARGATGQAAFQAYTACLSQHGVKLPTFSGRPFPNGSGRAFPGGSRRPRPSGSFVRPSGGFSRPPGGFGGAGGGYGGYGGFLGSATADPATQAALKACAGKLPQSGFGRGGQGMGISATTFAAFKSCMSDNGVTIAATDAVTGLRALNRTDAKTAAALKVCQPILGTAGKPGVGGSDVPTPAPTAS